VARFTAATRREWKIPWAESCIDVAKTTSHPFNLGVRKTAGPSDVGAWAAGKGPAGWVVWVGTGNQNWRVDNVGRSCSSSGRGVCLAAAAPDLLPQISRRDRCQGVTCQKTLDLPWREA